MIISAISARVHPELRSLVEPSAELAALGLDDLHRVELAQIIDENSAGTWVSDRELAAWQTVSDVIFSATHRGILSDERMAA